MAEEPKLLSAPTTDKSDHHESKEKLSGIFKKTSLIPSPSRNRKSMSTSKEDFHHLNFTDSTTSIADKSGERDERKHSFLNLFSRKHQPPTSLENLQSKTSIGRPHRDSSSGTTPSTSLSFLQKLSGFHSSHSPSSMPQTTAFSHMEEGRPVEILFPVKELDALEENAPQPTRHPTQPEEIWSEPTTSRMHTTNEVESRENSPPPEIQIQPPHSPTTERTSPFKKRTAMDEAAHEREQVQKALQNCLENFRAGKMRSLTNTQVQKMRTMHDSQLRLTELHKRVMLIDDPLKDDPEVNGRYDEIAKQLSELHKQMDEFSEATVA